MNELLKSFAWLLVYPDEDAREVRAEIAPLIADADDLDDGVRSDLLALLAYLDETPLLDVQAAYVETFDIGKDANLNLFEHLHGDSRDRGAAMLELTTLYRDHGLEFDSVELPDYLPAFLEFLSGLERDDAAAWLESIASLVADIDRELQYRASPYGAVTAALLALGGAERTLVGEKPISEVLPTVDADYVEPPVTFGGCPNVSACTGSSLDTFALSESEVSRVESAS